MVCIHAAGDFGLIQDHQSPVCSATDDTDIVYNCHADGK